MRAIISDDRSRAERIAAAGGKMRGDIDPFCVLAFTEQGGERRYGIFYHFGRAEFLARLARCNDICVLWAHPTFWQQFPQFSPAAA